MTDRPDFSINLRSLRKREKDSSPASIARTDKTAEEHGFVPREPKGRGGRKPSPRTGQVHAKVLPHIADEIAAEATRRGVTQGLLIEEAWALYLGQQRS